MTKIIGSAVRSRYGNKTTWRAERWLVLVPKLRCQGKDIHQLVIEVTTYLVAEAVARTGDDSRLATLVSPVGKPEILDLPMFFSIRFLKMIWGASPC